MDANEIYNKALTALGGAGVGIAYPFLRGAWSWWKRRSEEAERAISERAEESAEVKVAQVSAETAEHAQLLARIGELEDRQDAMFEKMRAYTEAADARVRELMKMLSEEQQKVKSAEWIIERRDEEIKRLAETHAKELEARDAQIRALHAEIAELNTRLLALEVKHEP